MNKLFNKIAVAFVGMAMAIGVGVAIGSKTEVKKAEATTITANFSNYTSSIAEGDYVFYVAYTANQVSYTEVMKNTVSSTKIQSQSLTLSAGKVVNPDDSIVWHIAPSGDYWTIQNVNNSKYVVATGSASQADLSATAGTKGLFSFSYSSGSWTITSKYNTDAGKNAKFTANRAATNYFACYAAGSSGIQLYKKDVIATTSVSVSPESATLTPGQTQQLTTTVLPANTTDVLTYSSNANDVATVSSSGLITAVADGEATITATSGSFSDTCIVTVATPSDPFINPSKNSTSGFSGQNETLSFVYGNLVSALSITSSNTSVVTVGAPSMSAGSGTVQINFAGAGTTTVKFNDGSTELASVSVDVTQSLRPVNADVTSQSTTTFTSKAFADANSGWTSNGTEGNGFTSGQGIQVTTGTTGAGATSKASFSNVTQIVVTYNTNKSAGAGSIDITIGSNAKQSQDAGYSSGDGTKSNYTLTYNYINKQSGTITIVVNTTTNSIWLKSITIITVTGSTNIANSSGHESAQKAVVKFAKAFNAAMDDTENCTEGLSTAWSTATSAWSTFTSEIAALSTTEEAYAKNLIKYATAQWTDDTDEDFSYCLERAMKTYEVCVKNHGQTAFMSTVRPLAARSEIVSFGNIQSDSTALVIVIISLVSLTAVGGFFFIRKRKEN